jgi:uncharacterized protein
MSWKALVAIGLALSVAVTRLADSGLRIPTSLKQWEMDPSAEAVSVTAEDGAVLRGALFRPEGPAKGAVIILHGIGDHGYTMGPLAKLLNRSGYVALTPDSRAHGGSGGEFVTYGLLEKKDVHRWLDLLEAKTSKGFPMFGYGASMGAGVILQALAVENRFHALIAECPFSDFRRVSYDRLSESLNGFPALLLAPVLEPAIEYARLRYGLALRNVSPIDALRMSSIPVLLIHGVLDEVVPIEHSRRLHQVGHTELWEVPNARHVETWAAAGKEFETRVVAWYDGHL